MNKNSIISLGHLSGADVNDLGASNSNYAAEFREVTDSEIKNYPFEMRTSRVIIRPWLGQKYEKTYNNYIKSKNEPEVNTYKHIIYQPVSSLNYESIITKDNYKPNVIIPKKKLNYNYLMPISLIIMIILFYKLFNLKY